MKEAGQSRRQFCVRAIGLTALGGGLASILQGCAGAGGGGLAGPSGLQNLPRVSGTDGTNSVTVTIDAGSALADVGSAALVQSPSALVLVAHVAQDSFVAYSPICTHQTCTITAYAGQILVCPCHGSEFDSTSGRVLQGPAPAPLHAYHTQFADGVLTITA